MERLEVSLKFIWANQTELRGPNLSFSNQTLDIKQTRQQNLIPKDGKELRQSSDN